jgi:hypothetical protein
MKPSVLLNKCFNSSTKHDKPIVQHNKDHETKLFQFINIDDEQFIQLIILVNIFKAHMKCMQIIANAFMSSNHFVMYSHVCTKVGCAYNVVTKIVVMNYNLNATIGIREWAHLA